MKISIKKRDMVTALKNVKSMTDAICLDADSDVKIMLTVKDSSMLLTSTHAESKIRDVQVDEEGEVTVDYQSLHDALSVSGDRMTIEHTDGSNADFKCGRSKGKISVSADPLSRQILDGAPKSKIQVHNLGELLSSLALRPMNDGTSDRSLHINAKKGRIRGESTDGLRGVIFVTEATVPDTEDSVSISLPQQACDRLSKLVTGASIGTDGETISVISAGFKAVIPLSSVPALEVLKQFTEWSKETACYDTARVKLKEIKSALSDVIGMVGKNLGSVDLELTKGGTKAKFSASASAGDVEATFEVDPHTLANNVTVSVLAQYLKEVLDFYSSEHIDITPYAEAVVIDAVQPEGSDIRVIQRTVVPLSSDAFVSDTDPSDDSDSED